MCVRVIVDANAFHHLHEPTSNSAGDQVRGWIVRGDGLVVYSSADTRYYRELKKSDTTMRLFEDYRQRGKAETIEPDRIQAALGQIPGAPVRRSDDPHVLALAVASRATVLLSCDRHLKTDFANERVIPKVGGHPRRSLPGVRLNSPGDTSSASRRRKFLEKQKCPASR